jgi:hypothetical protein
MKNKLPRRKPYLFLNILFEDKIEGDKKDKEQCNRISAK